MVHDNSFFNCHDDYQKIKNVIPRSRNPNAKFDKTQVRKCKIEMCAYIYRRDDVLLLDKKSQLHSLLNYFERLLAFKLPKNHSATLPTLEGSFGHTSGRFFSIIQS